jgi:ribosomal protein S27E
LLTSFSRRRLSVLTQYRLSSLGLPSRRFHPKGSGAMPLSPDLRDKLLTFNCPQCRHALAKKGAWFMAMSRIKCGGCGHTVPITYGDKLALFESHAQLIDP